MFAYAVPILVKVHTLREWTWSAVDGKSLMLEQTLKQVLFSHLGRVPGGFAYTFLYILFWWLILFWMYRKRVFTRI